MKPFVFPKVSIVFVFLFPALLSGQNPQSVDVWIGTGGNQIEMPEGIYKTTLSKNGSLTKPELFVELAGAGWVCGSPGKMMYCTGICDGKPGVVAFDPRDANRPVQFQAIGDGDSCFVTTDRSGRMLISAQYGGGSVAVFPIGAEGQLMPRSQLHEHSGGARVVGRRQNSPHPHYVAISPDNRFAFVPDLGLDQLVVYRIDVGNQKLDPAGVVDVVRGGGPRHMKFHPGGKFAFVLNELAMSVTTFAYAAGQMKQLGTVTTLTNDEQESNSFNSASEIRVHPNGKLVVTANRGHDSLSVFEFDEGRQDLHRVQLESVRGSWPRNFNFSPDGKFLIVAGKDSNSLAVFSVNAEENSIQYLQHKTVLVPAPICVMMD